MPKVKLTKKTVCASAAAAMASLPRRPIKAMSVVIIAICPSWVSAIGAITFASNAANRGEKPGTCAHFVIEKSGKIHQLVPLGVRCRHAIGLNHVSIGIEMVQAFGREDDVRDRFGEKAESVRDVVLEQAGVEAQHLPGLFFLPTLSIAAVVFWH